MTIKNLVADIIPHYNKYRKNKFTLSGTDILEISWEVGDLLMKFIDQSGVAPHALYREIYGKSEGKENITQKSYITREFLSRSYRIRKIFVSKAEIKKQLPNLTKFNNFREAMPFFDNPKYLLKDKEKASLYKLLNSSKSYGEILKEINKLQRERIGIKNPRNQKLGEMSGDKDVFVKFYNYVYDLFKLADYDKAKVEIKHVEIDFIKVLSKDTGAIAIDGLLMTDFEIPSTLNEQWTGFAKLVKRLITKEDSQDRRRFRRLIPPHRMTQLGEMLYQLTSEGLYKSFRL
jgi:hypothetical protein